MFGPYLVMFLVSTVAALLGAAFDLGKWETYALTAVIAMPTMIACMLWMELADAQGRRNGDAEPSA